MLPGFKCSTCTQVMERVGDFSWMCQRCRVNEHFPELAEDDVRDLLQREWDAGAA